MGPSTRFPIKLAAAAPWPALPNARPETNSGDNYLDEHRLIDRAYARCFEVISSGKLKSEAWFIQDVYDELSDPVLGNVPANAWTFRGFDLTECELVQGTSIYRAFQVEVAQALALFPEPEPSARVECSRSLGSR